MDLFLRYIHFLSILLIAGTLMSELFMLRNELSRKEISRISFIDLIYGLAALSLMAAGLTLWLGGYGKPTEWYSKNWIFHLKLGLFVAVGLLSIYPTIFFLKNRKGDPDEVISIPALIRYSIALEVIILMVIPILAGLMSKGIGLTL